MKRRASGDPPPEKLREPSLNSTTIAPSSALPTPAGMLKEDSLFARFDRMFFPLLRGWVLEDPINRIEELVRARLFMGMTLLVGISSAGSYTQYLFFSKTTSPAAHLRLGWLIFMLVIIPYQMRRATNCRRQCLVLCALANLWPWAILHMGMGFRSMVAVGCVPIPILTMFTTGGVTGALSIISTYLMLVGKYVLEKRMNHPFPDDALISDGMFLYAAFMNLFFLALFGYAYEMIRNMRVETLQAMNEQLSVAIKQTQQAAEMKTRFLANMSHEIRTPLNGIVGMSEILALSPLSATQRQELRIITECSTGLLNIVSDILDFSRIAADKIHLEEVHFSVDALIARCFDTVSLKAHEKQIELAHDLSGLTHSHFIGDPTRLQQIFLNLLSNAVKFTPDNGEVWVRAWSLSNGNDEDWFCCEVSDTGAGIGEEHRRTLFQPFSQGDAATTRLHGGAGLGLAITRSLVELMGGNIRVEAGTNGVGSVFAFQVRLRVPSDSPFALPMASMNTDFPSPPASQATVVLWDDCTSHERATRAMLTSFKCTVISDIHHVFPPSVQPLYVINLTTYQLEADREKTNFVIRTILAAIDRPREEKKRPIIRFVLLQNPITSSSHSPLDTFLARADVAPRILVLHSDRMNGVVVPEKLSARGRSRNDLQSAVTSPTTSGAPVLVESSSKPLTPNGSPQRVRANGPTVRTSLGGTPILIDSATGICQELPSTSSHEAPDPEAIVVEVILLTKPALPASLRQAVTMTIARSASGNGSLSGSGGSMYSHGSSSLSSGGEGLAASRQASADRALNLELPNAHPSGHETMLVLPRPRADEEPRTIATNVMNFEQAREDSTDSATGVGSAAPTIVTPPATTTPPTSAPGSRASASPGPVARQLVKLLLVEDNAVNVKVSVRLLQLLGYAAEVSSNGVEAVASVEGWLNRQREQPTGERLIVLMDLHMPVKGGMEAAAEIRALFKEETIIPAPYLIAVTADALESTRAECLTSHFNDFLSKPFQLVRLRQVLSRGLDGGEQGDAGE